jgi:hypothetical protein
MNLNLNDLSVLLAAIDVAVKRGAYSVLEVGQVGEAATKLNNFLLEAQKQQEEAQAAAAAAEGTEATAETTEATAEGTEATAEATDTTATA